MTEAKHLPVKSESSWAAAQRAPFSSLRREMERLFDDFDDYIWPPSFRQVWPQRPLSRNSLEIPAVDVAEKDAAFEITAELPGMKEKDIEVALSNGGLLIRGEKKAEKEEKKKDYYLHERNYGSFERYFSLPDGVAADQISASFENGILTVTLPKTKEAKASERKIPIKAAQ
jgi:HSP20 family protein